MSESKVEFFKDDSGQWRWHVKAARLRERIALWLAPWLGGGIRFGSDINLYRQSASGWVSDD